MADFVSYIMWSGVLVKVGVDWSAGRADSSAQLALGFALRFPSASAALSKAICCPLCTQLPCFHPCALPEKRGLKLVARVAQS